MKIATLKKELEFEGGFLAVRSSTEAPLREVAERGYLSFEKLSDALATAPFTVPAPPKEDSIWDFAEDIAVKEGDGERRFQAGIVFYNSLYALINFLASRYAPSRGESRLAALVEEAAGADGAVDRTRLEEQLVEQMNVYHQHGRWRNRPGRGGIPLPLIAVHEMEHHLVRARIGGRLHIMPEPDSDSLQLLCLPVAVMHRGRRVGRMSYVARFADPHQIRGDEHGMSILRFDGRRHRWLRSLADLKPGEAAELDAKGTLFGGSAFDILPREDRRARCVVRIPPADALAPLVERLARGARGGRRAPRSPCLRAPAFVADSGRPVCLEGSEPLVDDPADAAFLLTRTTRGIFVPGDAPKPFPADRLPGRSSYLILEEPLGCGVPGGPR